MCKHSRIGYPATGVDLRLGALHGCDFDRRCQAGRCRAVHRLPRLQRPGTGWPGYLAQGAHGGAGLGYQPPVARLVEPLADDRTTTVAVIVPDIANPVFAGFVKAAQSQGWYRRQTVVLADTDLNPDRERDVITHLRERVDGMVICSPRLDAEQILALCSRIPVVLVNREASGTDCVVADASDGLRQTIDYLAALGHRRIAYVQGSQLSWSNEHRVALVRSLTAEAGLDLQVLGWQAETVAGGTAAAASVSQRERPR